MVQPIQFQTYSLPIPENAKIRELHPETSYEDAFGIRLPIQYTTPPAQLFKLFFNSFPRWAQVLLFLREKIAQLIGLKTAQAMDLQAQFHSFTGAEGQSIGLFHVLHSSPTELVSGESDKHLDFLLSVIGRKQDNTFEIILATTVQFNGWLGELYFLPVRPIHKVLVPAMLKKMSKKLLEEEKRISTI